jgi:polyhydroxybutyrate depolymerase
VARALVGRFARPALIAIAQLVVGCASDGILGIDESTSFSPGTALHTITVGSLQRSYIVHVPSRRPMTQSGTLLPYPLTIVLHGSSGTGEDIRGTTNMDSVSDVNRIVVVYPNAVAGAGGLFPTDWNAGNCCGAAGREGIDDLGFMRAMIDELSAKLPIDKRRIHVAGFSDGGRMAYYMACQMAGQIAAIGVVSGSLRDDSCTPAHPVAVIALHGTADPIVPYDESIDSPMPDPVDATMDALPPSVQFWIAQDGCSAATDSAFTPSVTRTTFAKCSGSDVAFFSIDGGVHTWPVLVDPSSSDPDQTVSATALITDFFKRHHLN